MTPTPKTVVVEPVTPEPVTEATAPTPEPEKPVVKETVVTPKPTPKAKRKKTVKPNDTVSTPEKKDSEVQWQRKSPDSDTWENIPNATQSTYVVTEADKNTQIRAQITDDDSEIVSYTESVWASAPKAKADAVPKTGVNETLAVILLAIGSAAAAAVLILRKKRED